MDENTTYMDQTVGIDGQPQYNPNQGMAPNGQPQYNPNQGMAPNGQPQYYQNQGMAPNGQPQYNPNQGMGPYGQPQYNPNNVTPNMGWHKFLIYFSLFAGAVINFVMGILYLTGSIYEVQSGGFRGASKFVYHYFDGLQAVDIIFGILLIAFAVFGIFVRFQLAKFKQGAPQKLNILYFGIIILQVIYIIVVSAIVGDVTMSIFRLIPSIGIAIVNVVYYKERKSMFVN